MIELKELIKKAIIQILKIEDQPIKRLRLWDKVYALLRYDPGFNKYYMDLSPQRKLEVAEFFSKYNLEKDDTTLRQWYNDLLELEHIPALSCSTGYFLITSREGWNKYDQMIESKIIGLSKRRKKAKEIAERYTGLQLDLFGKSK